MQSKWTKWEACVSVTVFVTDCLQRLTSDSEPFKNDDKYQGNAAKA